MVALLQIQEESEAQIRESIHSVINNNSNKINKTKLTKVKKQQLLLFRIKILMRLLSGIPQMITER